MLKKLTAFLLTGVLLFASAACGNKTDASLSPTPAVSDTPAPTEMLSALPTPPAFPEMGTGKATPCTYPQTVTDQAGRTVTIEQEPERIASAYYISTSMLLALGLQNNLVGIEAKADKRNIYRLAAPQLIDLPSMGTAKEFNTEACIAAAPDVVFLPMKLAKVADTLEEFGIRAIVVNPENNELFMECLTLIGTVTNSMDKTVLLKETIDTFLSYTKETVASEAAPRVYLAGNSDLLSTAGSQMFQNSLVTNAGGINVASELSDTYWANVSYEQLLAWNPEFIVIAADASYTVEDVLNNENLALCDAVKNKNVVKLPGNIEAWDSPVPGAFLGSLYLASVLHPQLITTDFYQSCVTTFYNNFYGFTPAN